MTPYKNKSGLLLLLVLIFVYKYTSKNYICKYILLFIIVLNSIFLLCN